jgi:hypothetical protein
LWLLERSLGSRSSRIRDGAVLGLAFLDDAAAIPYLRQVIDREPVKELRADMEQVLAQLESSLRCHSSYVPQEPYPELARDIIREQGKPLTGDEITSIARSKGKTVKRTSLMGGLYRCLKEGKFFTLVAPGTFGLIEWENHSEEHKESFFVPSSDVTTTEDPLHENAPSELSNGAF